MDFPERLKQLRKERNLTQEELGALLRYGRTAISGYESGRNEPAYETLRRLSDYFGCSVDYLLGNSDIRNPLASQKEESEKDIAKKMDDILKELEQEEGLMFDGRPADLETLELVKQALEMGRKMADMANKKYTPKKYKK